MVSLHKNRACNSLCRVVCEGTSSGTYSNPWMGKAHPINAEFSLNFKLSVDQECLTPITAVDRTEGLSSLYCSTEDSSFTIPQESVSQCSRLGALFPTCNVQLSYCTWIHLIKTSINMLNVTILSVICYASHSGC